MDCAPRDVSRREAATIDRDAVALAHLGGDGADLQTETRATGARIEGDHACGGFDEAGKHRRRVGGAGVCFKAWDQWRQKVLIPTCAIYITTI